MVFIIQYNMSNTCTFINDAFTVRNHVEGDVVWLPEEMTTIC